MIAFGMGSLSSFGSQGAINVISFAYLPTSVSFTCLFLNIFILNPCKAAMSVPFPVLLGPKGIKISLSSSWSASTFSNIHSIASERHYICYPIVIGYFWSSSRWISLMNWLNMGACCFDMIAPSLNTSSGLLLSIFSIQFY